MNISKKQKQIIVFLIIIVSVSVFLKLYTFDFSTPEDFDNLGYTLDAIQYSQGDFFMPQKKNPGWPLFIAPFYSLLNSDNRVSRLASGGSAGLKGNSISGLRSKSK